MLDFLLNIFSSDTAKALIIPVFSLLTILYTNKNNRENLKIQMDNDIKKFDHGLKRDVEKNRLNMVYKPIIRIYERAGSEKYRIDNYYAEGSVLGTGIDEHSREAIEKIVESNLHLMRIEEILKYENALNEMREDEVTVYKNHFESMSVNELNCYLFDEKKEFINSIKEEAMRIENEFQ